jgi:hypothetical protein
MAMKALKGSENGRQVYENKTPFELGDCGDIGG